MGTAAGINRRFLGVLVGLVALGGCAEFARPGATEPLPAGSCPAAAAARTGGAVIDWVPFVVVDHVMFRTVYGEDSVLTESQVGAVVATVTCRIGDAVDDPDFRPREGDAAYLPVGTTLHAVVGAPVTTKLAAREDGDWRLYEAVETVP